MEELEKNIATQATFACERIQEPCPFIKIINKKTFDQLEGQKNTYMEQKDTIEKTISTREEEIKNIQKNIPQEENTTIETLQKKFLQTKKQ